MFARLHVIISSEEEKDYETVKQECLSINHDFSISPARPYPLQKGHSEFYITFHIHEDEIQPLLDQLNNDWDGDKESCSCYGFNTKMFHPLVYCLEFDVFE